MKKNKGFKFKGFTFIELLAAVTILGIISVIAISGVSRILERSHDEYYKNQEKNLILAAQSYMNNNKNKLPKIIGKKTKVTAKTLKEANYLKKDITEYDGKTVCDEDNTYVNVFKYGKTDYSYTAVVSCTNYLSNEANTDTAAPKIDVDFSTNKEDLRNAKVTINMLGDSSGNTKILSYNYSLYVVVKSGSNVKYVELYNTGNREAGRVSSLTKTIDVSKYTISSKPVGLQVRVTVTNINGISKTVYESKGYEDTTKPICDIKDEDKPDTTTGVKDWVNNQRTITVGCKDGNGSGCDKPSYTKTFTADNIVDYITIYDDAGNSQKCNVTTYIDKTKPTIKVTAYKCKRDSNNNLVEDTTKKVGDKTISSDGTWSSADLDDNHNGWLNKANYPNGVCFVIETSDNLALGSKSWKWNSTGHAKNASGYKTLDGGSSNDNDINAGKYKTADYINKKTYKPSLSAEGHRYGEFTITDGYGNSTTLKLDIKIDRTAPSPVPTTNMKKWSNNDTRPTTAGSLGGYTNNTWSPVKVFTYPSGSSDSISGGVYYQYTTTGVTTNATNTTATYRNVEAQGVSYITWRAVDEAGNPSSHNSTSTIKLDWTKPSITVKVFKRTSSGGKTGSALATKTVNNSSGSGTLNSSDITGNHNGWFNKDYPNGLYYEVSISDNIAIASKSWEWNTSGLKADNANRHTLNGGSSNDTNFNVTTPSSFTTSRSYTHSLEAAGYRYGRITATDAKGNSIYMNIETKMDRGNPSCDIDKSHTWTTDGVTLTTTCADSMSGVASCEGQHTGVTSSKTYYPTDNAGNTGSCSKSVSSQRQEKHRSRSWNSCKTGDPSQCVAGYTANCPADRPQTSEGSWGCSSGSRYMCCGDAAHQTNCYCRPYSSCASTINTCQGGWNDWGNWSDWNNCSSCSEGQYDDGAKDRDCRTLYY